MFTTPAGLLVSGGVHQVDHVRVFRVITRIAKGLYFHHKEKPAPASFRVEVIPEPAFPQPAAAEILERLEKKSWQEVGKGEFSYKYLGAGDGTTEVWAWLLRFYGVVPFLVLFIQSRDEGPDDTENVPDPKVIEAFSKIWGLPETLLPTQ